ncbi:MULTISPECIES: FUSC family protein [unclassified Microbacterium]|uniref:FUSC family protein n=1 Tax=unclassified Microbacterium TaxID=2609290 RepID=UPI00365640BA
MNAVAPPTPAGGRLVVQAALLMAIGAVPVVAALLLVGSVAAQSVYLGIVVATTVVRALHRPQQWIGAVWIAVVAGAGSLIGPAFGPLLVAVVICALAQAVFLRWDPRALAVAPAILVFDAVTMPAGSAGLVALSTFAGAAFLIGAAALVGLAAEPRPLSWGRAISHAMLLAAGCAVLLFVGAAFGAERLHWGPLAFCLAFVPGPGTARSALRYAIATMAGSAAAVAIGVLAPGWLVVGAIVVGALLVVASTLAERLATAVAAIAATVILLGTLSPGLASPALGFERIGSALLAVGVGLLLLLIAEPLENLVTCLLARTRLAEPAPEGNTPWIR